VLWRTCRSCFALEPLASSIGLTLLSVCLGGLRAPFHLVDADNKKPQIQRHFGNEGNPLKIKDGQGKEKPEALKTSFDSLSSSAVIFRAPISPGINLEVPWSASRSLLALLFCTFATQSEPIRSNPTSNEQNLMDRPIF
jgi:hypothetical protein